MYKKFIWILALITSFTLTQMVFADTTVCRDKLSKMVQSLNLDESQKAKIKPILDQLKTDLQTSGSQMKDFHTQITQQVNSANMDQDKVNDLVDKKTKVIADMIKAKLKAQNQIYVILNPQQKEKLQNMIKTADDKIAAIYKNCEQD